MRLWPSAPRRTALVLHQLGPAARGTGNITVARAPLFVAGALALGYLLLLGTVVDPLLPGHGNWDKPWDHQKYLAMAEQPLDLRIAPFSWRLLGPLIAGILPFSISTSFRITASLAVWLTAVAMFVLLRRLGHRDVLATVGMLLCLSLWWVAGYPLYNFWLPDALVYLSVLVLAIAAGDRRPVLFAIVLVVGVLAKEQVLIAAPLWYGLRTGRLFDGRRLAEMVAVAFPALVLLVAVRIILPAGNTDPAYLAQLGLALNVYDQLPPDPQVLFQKFGTLRLPAYRVLTQEWTSNAFGVLPLLGLAALPRSLVTLARWAPFIVLVYAQPMLAANTTRLIALAFPVIVILAVDGLAAIQNRLALPDLSLLAGAGSLLGGDLLAGSRTGAPVHEALLLAVTMASAAVLARIASPFGRSRPSAIAKSDAALVMAPTQPQGWRALLQCVRQR